MIFTNIDQVPAGKHMYTVYVTTDPRDTPRSQLGADEVDVVAPANAEWGVVVDQVASELVADYGVDSWVVGVVNQSRSVVIYDDAAR